MTDDDAFANGFKQTEIGLIPEEWRVVQLGNPNVAHLIMGQSPTSDTYNAASEGLPFFQGKADFGSKYPTPSKWCSAPIRIAEPNDVLMSVRAPVGDVNLASTRCCIGRGLAAIRAGSRSHPEFLFYLLTQEKTRIERQGSGTTFMSINKDVLKIFSLPLPPLPEQRAIAHVLSKIQAAAEAQAAVVGRARELKRALMAKLFTEGLRGEPLKETEIGVMPERWEVPELSQVVEIVYGAQAAVANALEPSIGTPILTNINITNDGSIDLSTLRYYKVPENKRERLILRKGDLLFNWRSGSQDHVGKTALFDLDGEYTFASFILRFRTSEKVSNSFLRYYLYHIKSQGFFAQYRQQSSVNSVFNASAAAKIPIVLPSLDEQREIARILQTVDAKIAAAEHKRAGLEELFRAMLGELMTGRVRATPLIDSNRV